MRQFKRFFAVTLLSLAIGTSAFAGDVQAPACADPQPPAPITEPTPPPVDTSTQTDAGASSLLTTITVELVRLMSIF